MSTGAPRPSTVAEVRSHLVSALEADLVGPFLGPAQADTAAEELPLPPSRTTNRRSSRSRSPARSAPTGSPPPSGSRCSSLPARGTQSRRGGLDPGERLVRGLPARRAPAGPGRRPPLGAEGDVAARAARGGRDRSAGGSRGAVEGHPGSGLARAHPGRRARRTDGARPAEGHARAGALPREPPRARRIAEGRRAVRVPGEAHGALRRWADASAQPARPRRRGRGPGRGSAVPRADGVRRRARHLGRSRRNPGCRHHHRAR